MAIDSRIVKRMAEEMSLSPALIEGVLRDFFGGMRDYVMPNLRTMRITGVGMFLLKTRADNARRENGFTNAEEIRRYFRRVEKSRIRRRVDGGDSDREGGDVQGV